MPHLEITRPPTESIMAGSYKDNILHAHMPISFDDESAFFARLPSQSLSAIVSLFKRATYLPLAACIPLLFATAKPVLLLFSKTMTWGYLFLIKCTEPSVEPLSTII